MPHAVVADEYLSVTAAARFVGVHRTTVWKWIRAGVLRSFETPNGRVRVLRADLVKPRKR